MKKLILGLFVAFGFSACSLSDGNNNYVDCGANTLVNFTGFPFACNYNVKSMPNNPAALVIVSQEKMDQYFTKHANSCQVASDPNIDFTKEYLVGIFAGAKPTSGYTIKITSIIENNCEIVVNYYEKAPAEGENVTQAPTYPSDFILIPKTTKGMIFNRTVEVADNIIIGSFSNQCTGADCQKFYQLNDYNILKFLKVEAGKYDFGQYKYTPTIKRGEYSLLLKSVPAEILALKGQTKTYGSPDAADQGGIYFELRQGASVTRIYIDNNDTADQSAEIKLFKKAIQEKITALK
ncbi:protease complex subunit PrcB family protein [Flavobacterium nitrogenifigens]|uniref:PrcB C-terminal n=1 Tax=Flavobacterium nitrogenifigens TaxID=1617283 RepID=A0A521EKR9_9FLAO|nr:protease complex subunit PrcB family protein [Flavobacterium nitrogenifigens]KAF2326170.1 protease complex subunit PrcB family protein [Flavobacterium nitrogenifigens]SMO84503.1 PrcB C-terminal [Flavobacterium nitrogenifigens]